MSKLIIQPAGAPPMPHELGEELVTIGRSPDNTIAIDDPSVSGKHAQLNRVGETFHLQDLNSTNGTRVNGEVITSTALRVGDRIRFGKVEAAFESDMAGAQSLPALSVVEVRPAEVSERPADFANASPFPRRKSSKDATRSAIFAAAAVAILAFIASMITLVEMRPPTP